MAEKAPHRLVLAPGVLQAYQRPAALGGTSRGLSAPLAALEGPEARPVAVGHSSPSWRGHSTNSRDSSCAERATLLSAMESVPPWSRPRGVGAPSGPFLFLLPSSYPVIYSLSLHIALPSWSGSMT